MDQLSCIRMFIRVVEQGSFVRVAETLSVALDTVTVPKVDDQEPTIVVTRATTR